MKARPSEYRKLIRSYCDTTSCVTEVKITAFDMLGMIKQSLGTLREQRHEKYELVGLASFVFGVYENTPRLCQDPEKFDSLDCFRSCSSKSVVIERKVTTTEKEFG